MALELQTQDINGNSVSQYSWETTAQFKTRVQFIQDHIEDNGFDQALTLAMIYNNKFFLGCRYSAETEKQIEHYPKPKCLEIGIDSIARRRLLANSKKADEDFVQNLSQSSVPHEFSIELQQLCIGMSLSPYEDVVRYNKHPVSELIIFTQSNLYSCIFHQLDSPQTPGDQTFGFNVEIEGVTVSKCELIKSRLEAKRKAAHQAIETIFRCQTSYGYLEESRKETQNRMRLQRAIPKSDLTKLQNNDLMSSAAQPISSGPGFNLLRKSGWSGDVEQNNNSISAQPTGEVCFNREGLGCRSGDDINFDKIDQMLINFVKSNEEELVFSSELSSSERKLVHNLAQKYNLKHDSQGRGGSRYLVVTRKSQHPPPIIPMPHSDPYNISSYPRYNAPNQPIYSHIPPPTDYRMYNPSGYNNWRMRTHNFRGNRGRGRDRSYHYHPY